MGKTRARTSRGKNENKTTHIHTRTIWKGVEREATRNEQDAAAAAERAAAARELVAPAADRSEGAAATNPN